MTESAIVLWTVCNNKITGQILQDVKGRQKIVFLKDYRPESRGSEDTLTLPKDCEKWECEICYDTIPESVYTAWDDRAECFPSAYESDVHPKVKAFVEKFHAHKNPARAGALIVTLKPGGNITLREEEEARREEERRKAFIVRHAREKKEAEEREKLKYQGHEVINHFYPGLDFSTFQAIHKACTLIAKNKIFPAIKAGMENGIEGYREALCKLKFWPEDFTIYKARLLKNSFTIQAKGYVGFFASGPDEDANKIFALIYNWLTREENTTSFEMQNDNTYVCAECSGKIIRKKEEVQSAMKTDQRLLCEHCGRSGIPQRVHKKCMC
ncbi:TPA: hypothetical protein DEP58_01180 [Patescibacteria group bacterium]|nr:hypothetical protein [Patescibacteria group bacterium]